MWTRKRLVTVLGLGALFCASHGCAGKTGGTAGCAVDATSVYWVNTVGDTVMKLTPK